MKPGPLVLAATSLALVCAGAGRARAQNETSSPSESSSQSGAPDYETTVSSERPPSLAEPAPLAPADVQTIGREELLASGAATMQEALARLAGIDVADEQGNGAQMDVFVRGVPASPVTGLPQGVSVFVDGVRVNEPTVEEVNFDLLPLGDVERVIVVRGPGALAGRNTLAAAIYILTRRGGRRAVEAEVGAGSFAERHVRARAGGARGRWDGYLSAGYGTEDGYRQASAARSAQLFAKVGFGGPHGDATLSYQLQADRLQQPGSLPASLLAQDRRANFSQGDFFAPRLHQMAINSYRAITPGLFVVAQEHLRLFDSEQFNANAAPEAGDTRLRSRSRSWGAGVALVHRRAGPWTRHELRVGVEGALHRVDVRVVTQPVETPAACDPVREDCAGAEPTAVLEDAQTALGFFAHEAFQIGPALLGGARTLSLSVGLRGDRIAHDVSDTTPATPGAASGTARFSRLLPAAAVRYGFSRRLTVGALYAEGFRAPAFLELTCAQPESPCVGLQAGVAPDTGFGGLRPVRARDYEIDVDLQTDGGGPAGVEAGLEAALYRMDLLDDIFSVSPNGRTDVYFQNVGRTRRQGLELRGRARWRTLSLRAAYGFVRATFEDPVTLGSPRLDVPEAVPAGARIPLTPEHTARAAISWSPLAGLTLAADFSYVGSAFFRGDEANTQPRLRAHGVAAGAVRYQRGPFWAAVRVANVLNRRYETFGTYAANAGTVEPFLSPGLPISAAVQLGWNATWGE